MKNILHFLIMLGLFVGILYEHSVFAKDKYIYKEVASINWGSNNGQLGFTKNNPQGLPVMPSSFTVDSNGNIYISDVVNKRVVIIDKEGKFVKNIKEPSMERASLSYIGVDGGNNIYVFDRRNKVIKIFDQDGKTKDSITGIDKNISKMNVSYNGSIQILEKSGHKKLSNNGTTYKKADIDETYYTPSGKVYTMQKDRKTLKPEEKDKKAFLLQPGDEVIDFDRDDMCYISNYSGNKVKKIDPNGNTIIDLDFTGFDIMGDSSSRQVRTDLQGNVYKMYYTKYGVKIVKMEKVK